MEFGLALEGVRWSAGLWLLARVPRVRATGDGERDAQDGGSSCAIVIPARDEVMSLPRLLASLGTAVASPAEIVVVDDHSSDGTADVARAHGARVVAAESLPTGWTGKAWACATGARQSGGDPLVFLDADTVFERHGLERVLDEWRRRRGLVSVQPFHAIERPYEVLSAFFNVIALMGVDACTPLGERVRPTGAFGPCMVIGRDDYNAVGGHAAVRGEVLDDVALARNVADRGGRVTCLGGRGTVRFRMYPVGVAQLIEGWTKNFAGGAARTRPLTLVLVAAWLSGCIVAPIRLATDPSGVSAAIYAAWGAQLWWMFRRVGRFGVAAVAVYPVLLTFFLVVFVRSLFASFVRRRVTWRGRTIET